MGEVVLLVEDRGVDVEGGAVGGNGAVEVYGKRVGLQEPVEVVVRLGNCVRGTDTVTKRAVTETAALRDRFKWVKGRAAK